MSTAIPSSMSYEMLSRLPASSFVLHWREVRPDQAPAGGVYKMSERNKVRFVLNGAPNEFALNTNIKLCGSAHLNCRLPATGNLEAGTNALNNEDVADWAVNPSGRLNSASHFFQSSRESFNAGALPFLDNQDIIRSHEINNLRARIGGRRAIKGDYGGQASVAEDMVGAFGCNQNTLNFSPANIAIQGTAQSAPTRLLYFNSTSASVQAQSFGKDKDFCIPLGLYSNFVNSPSVVPLGLLSSYAVNGWQIELETTQQTGISGRVYLAEGTRTHSAGTSSVGFEAVMRDLRIYIPVIRVLDPAVMEAVLSLYEKREQVSVGGVSFPLSLRMNQMAYRFSSFPLNSNQKDYFFRIAGTDRSVRAYAWWVYDKSRNNLGVWNLLSPLRVSRLETSIGTEHPHEVVEDTDVNTNNVSNFIKVNQNHSGAMFSPLPYYQEGRKHDGQPEDELSSYNNVTGTFVGIPTPNEQVTTDTKVVERAALCYGVVSLENLDRREGDYSGSFQASGKDLTNVGAIEVRMRIEQPNPPTGLAATATIDALDTWGTPTPPSGNDYEIIFAYAYDSVMEVSPQGVVDISNAVL